jgi:hypothetical protein
MEYVVNIALHDRHFAKVTVGPNFGSQMVARELRARFPATEGYSVTLTLWKTEGRPVAIEPEAHPRPAPGALFEALRDIAGTLASCELNRIDTNSEKIAAAYDLARKMTTSNRGA